MSGELLCQRCHQNYVVWFTSNDVWNDVMRGGDRGNPDEFAYLCPTCFTFLAEIQGIRPTAWEVRPEHFGVEHGGRGDPGTERLPTSAQFRGALSPETLSAESYREPNGDDEASA